ncbi:hypothetical protein JL49_13275 [Pseudoalteromonas luteoviolacea]|nr:hypothetical protein JL49_13275 [Pseudoalteromonas luteoviolacea]
MLIECLVNDLSHPVMGAALSYELDDKAERFALIDRATLRVVEHRSVTPTGRVFVPLTYATQENLSLIIFDDTGEFNAEIADHIKADFENMK